MPSRISPPTVQVSARDDAGHVQVVTAGTEADALVELCTRLGFEDIE